MHCFKRCSSECEYTALVHQSRLLSDAFAGRKHFFYSLFMEFLGLMLFSLFGNSVTPEFAPAGNGAQEQMGNADFTVQASSTTKVQVVSHHVLG
jgi:hypothetical protein